MTLQVTLRKTHSLKCTIFAEVARQLGGDRLNARQIRTAEDPPLIGAQFIHLAIVPRNDHFEGFDPHDAPTIYSLTKGWAISHDSFDRAPRHVKA